MALAPEAAQHPLNPVTELLEHVPPAGIVDRGNSGF
jgi:hypothetical protein